MSGTLPPASIEATPCGGASQGVICGLNNNQNTVLVNASAGNAFYVLVVP